MNLQLATEWADGMDTLPHPGADTSPKSDQHGGEARILDAETIIVCTERTDAEHDRALFPFDEYVPTEVVIGKNPSLRCVKEDVEIYLIANGNGRQSAASFASWLGRPVFFLDKPVHGMNRETIVAALEASTTVQPTIAAKSERKANCRTLLPKANMPAALLEGVERQAADQLAKPLPSAVSIVELAAREIDHNATLLGERWLCIGGGALFIGPSGIGKSSASVQQDILWGLGRSAFGIAPARPLKILCIQAENDDGDLSEMARGVMDGLAISCEDRNALSERVLYATEQSRTGPEFLSSVVRPLLENHRPDLLRLDPLLAYLGADPCDMGVTASFLRNSLNPLLTEFACGCIINHHTPKVTNRDTTAWRTSDWMYAGAGSADLTNWCRAAIVIDPTYTVKLFKFIAAKRAGRTGWRDEEGCIVLEKYFCHAEYGIHWREASSEDIERMIVSAQKKKDKDTKTENDLLRLIPLQGAVEKNILIEMAHRSGISEKRANLLIKVLLAQSKAHEWQIKRPNARAAKHISRHEQTLT
jgi:hypothetical protein